MSSFDKDFGRQFEPVEETMVLGDLASKLMERYPPNAPEIAKEHRLRIIDPNGEEWEYPVHGEVMIGRAPDNHITLNDRSVSRHHLALNTDGTLYWFQDLNSGNGTQVNNEFMQEGWLTGGEEIVVGNSRLYFLLPDLEAPPELVAAMGDDAAEQKEGNAEGAQEAGSREEYQEAASDEVAAVAAPEEPGGAQWVVAFVFFIGLVGASMVGLWIYRRTRAPVKVDKPIERREQSPSPVQQAVQLLREGEQLLDQKKWAEAEKLLLRAANLLPIGDKFRSTIVDRAKVATRELRALAHYKKASRQYRYNFDAKEALLLIRKIPKDTSAYPKAKQLLDLIRRKELDTQLRMANLLVEAKKKDIAVAKVKKILELDPNYTKARVMLKKLTEDTTTPTEVRVVPRQRPRSRRRVRATGSLQTGLSYYRSGQVTRAIIFFRRQESAAGRRSTRRQARRYRRYAQAYQRGWSGGRSAARRGRTSRAISLLVQAYRADRALGGNQRGKIGQLLSKLYYRRGKQNQNNGNYGSAASDYNNARSYNSRNTKAYLALQSLRKKAKAILEEGEVLIGVSNSEARKKILQAKRLLSSSDPLYRKANRLLSRTQ